MIDILLTAEEFMDQRFAFQDEGRWSELHRGQVVHWPPENDRYGKVVMNISRYLADYFQLQRNGYACFHTGVLVSQKPDSLYFPAISIFLEGKLFGETDHEIASQVPHIILELLFSASRWNQFPLRVEKYFQHGIKTVLGINLFNNSITYCERGEVPREIQHDGFIMFEKLLPGFKLELQQVFITPEE